MAEVSVHDANGNTEAEILQLLRQEYPGKLLFSIREVAEIIRLKPGTLYNRISQGNCPVRFSRKGGKPMCLISDLARGIAQLRG
jgi:hypothetical protein